MLLAHTIGRACGQRCLVSKTRRDPHVLPILMFFLGGTTMILVTGATGNIGSELLQQLATTGAQVRAFVRDKRQARSFLLSGPHLRPYLRSIVEMAGVERAGIELVEG